jgi:hypothetical protein
MSTGTGNIAAVEADKENDDDDPWVLLVPLPGDFVRVVSQMTRLLPTCVEEKTEPIFKLLSRDLASLISMYSWTG